MLTRFAGTFVDHAKRHGVGSLVGRNMRFPGDESFYKHLDGVMVTETRPGFVGGKFTVAAGQLNAQGTLFGGYSSVLVDAFGTLATLSCDKDRPGVSLDLNVTFSSAAEVGESIYIEANCDRHGRRVSFTSVKLVSGRTGKPIVFGRHTKLIG